MHTEIKVTKIGGSQYIIVPSAVIKIYSPQKYIWCVEVSRDGKTMTYRRMRKNEKLSNPDQFSI